MTVYLNSVLKLFDRFSCFFSNHEHVSDVFAKLGAASATDYKDLAIALSKVSAQANTAGMSMEFTTTLLAKGLEVTQEAPESIGTALKTVLARMRELSDYGSTLEDNTSVNKVENALKSSFRELSKIYGGSIIKELDYDDEQFYFTLDTFDEYDDFKHIFYKEYCDFDLSKKESEDRYNEDRF